MFSFPLVENKNLARMSQNQKTKQILDSNVLLFLIASKHLFTSVALKAGLNWQL